MRNYRGTLENNPFDSSSAGDKIFFGAWLTKNDLDCGAWMWRDLSVFAGSQLMLLFNEGDITSVTGGAIMIAPGTALCATHVISDYTKALVAGTAKCLAIGCIPEGLQLWKVRHLTTIGNTDLTLLSMEPASAIPSDRTYYQAEITTRLPSIGEQLTLAGFLPDSDNCSPEEEFQIASIRGRLTISKGVVTAIYPISRDACVLPWPVVEVDCSTWGGMSGGPVFDSSGRLVGILCSSFGTEGPSYCSLLWPALGARLLGNWPRGMFRAGRRLAEPESLCFLDKPEAISLGTDEFGKDRTIYYPWELLATKSGHPSNR